MGASRQVGGLHSRTKVNLWDGGTVPKRLAAFLTARYGVSCTVHFAKGRCLRVNAGRNREIERSWEAVAPHVVPPLRYKLPLRHREVPCVPRAAGREERFARAVQVLGLALVLPTKRAFRYGRVELVTTTGNLLAKGVVVADAADCRATRLQDHPGRRGLASYSSPTTKEVA